MKNKIFLLIYIFTFSILQSYNAFSEENILNSEKDYGSKKFESKDQLNDKQKENLKNSKLKNKFYSKNKKKFQENNFKKQRRIKYQSIGACKALDALRNPSFSSAGVWDLNILSRDLKLKNRLKEFYNDECCLKVKNLKLSELTKQEIIKILEDNDFKLVENPGRMDNLLGAGKDKIYQDAGLIYVHKDGSIVRVKDSSFKRKFRKQAHVIKAVLYDANEKPSWANEAFKVSNHAVAIPKSLDQKYGLKTYESNSKFFEEEKRGYITLLMEESHVDIKE